jgi:uncharacterized membrane protein YesL
MFKGFFNRMYNGNPDKPDIDAEDMPKNRFELFFTTLGVRIGDLVKLNLIFVVFILPVIIWSVLSFSATTAGLEGLSASLGHNASTAEQTAFIMNQLLVYLLFLPIFLALSGPPLAGLTYIVRNYARDEHAWLWSDFKEQMKKNWKQSAAVMFILGLVFLLVFYTLQFYAVAMQQSSWMWIMQLLFIVFVGMFVLSYMYVLPMLVTYKLKVTQIFRNSLMLALGRLPFTLLFGVITIFPIVLAFIILAAYFAVVNYVLLVLGLYYVVLGFGLSSFILNSYTNATFDKLLKSEDDEPKSNDGDREVMP